MLFRKTAATLALAALTAPAVFAGTDATWVGGEIGFVGRPVQSTPSRADVRKEFLEFRANPVTADGGQLVGGEAGYVWHQHTYVVQRGTKVHADKYAIHAAQPSRPMSNAERRAVQEQYVN